MKIRNVTEVRARGFWHIRPAGPKPSVDNSQIQGRFLLATAISPNVLYSAVEYSPKKKKNKKEKMK